MRSLVSYAIAAIIIIGASYALYQFRDVNFTQSTPQTQLELDIQTAHLSNGMEVVVVPNHRVPAISHTLWLRVGAADDPVGKSGLAHYLEHLMFKGTPSVPSGEFSKTIERLGGQHNAFTGSDFTGYYVNIAKEHLETVMRLEADRFQHLSVPESEYEQEREVIIEERRMRIDNSPAAQLNEQLNALMFQHHPYRIPIIGWKHEMEELSLQDAEAFYEQMYHPGNMLLVISGDVTMEEVQPLAERYYGTIAAKQPYERHWLKEPKHIADVSTTLRHAQVQQPRYTKRYMAPSLVYGEKEHAEPLMLLAQWLGGGKTSLLYQTLVVEQQLATSASAHYSALNVGPSQFIISVTPAPGVSMKQIEGALDAIIYQMLEQPIGDKDLRRIKTLLKAEVIYARDGLAAIAHFVGYLRMMDLDVSYFTDWTKNIEAVDASSMMRAAQTVLTRPSLTGYLLPESMPTIKEPLPEKEALIEKTADASESSDEEAQDE